MAWIIGLAMSAAWFAAMVATGASLRASRLEEEMAALKEEMDRLDKLVLAMGSVIEVAEEAAEERWGIVSPTAYPYPMGISRN